MVYALLTFPVLSAVFLTSKDLVTKYLSSRVSPEVSTFASFFFALPFYLLAFPVLWMLGIENLSIGGSFWIYIVLRASTDAFAESFKMKSLKFGDISLVSPMYSMAPIWLLFTSPLITGDKNTAGAVIGVVLAVAGSLVILLGDIKASGENPVKGVLFAVLSSIFMSLNTCFDRLAVQSASPFLSGFILTLLAGIFVTPSLLKKSDAKSQLTAQYKPFFLRGFFEAFFMVFKLIALQYFTAPVVVTLLRISLIFTVFGGRFGFKERDFGRRVFGAVLVILGSAISIHY